VITVTKEEVLGRVRGVGIIPVLAIADAVVAGGIDALEVTMTVPDALRVLRAAQSRYPGALIGAGTVMDAEQARACMAEGAQFVVSPALSVETIEVCRRNSIAVFPGALTPTEIANAWRAGGDAIKVFPASAMGGASYLKSLRGPLPQIRVIPTGGVSTQTAAEFFQAGAFALGVGGDLCDSAAIAEGNAAKITETARRYVAIVSEFRRGNHTASTAR
jgi:2-dehydro-3-deoxyphosphogluconate aldolase / (4S)-4-hydroxy-2-oxoglutarate aldolase